MGGAGRELTAKQKRFARYIAEGNTGADAYRKAYNTNAKNKKTQGDAASRVKADARVSAEINRLKALQEIREQHSPAQLRATVIERLQLEATDAENPPSARIRALELLGKVTEVAAFTERREQTVIHSSEHIRNQIMDRLRTLTIDITPQSVDDGVLSLEAELNVADADPTVPAPTEVLLESRSAEEHIIPHESTSTFEK